MIKKGDIYHMENNVICQDMDKCQFILLNSLKTGSGM